MIPGRYPGEAIQIHDGPTPEQLAYEEQQGRGGCVGGEDLRRGRRDVARCQFVLLELLGEFDADRRACGIGPGSNRWRIGCRGLVP